MKFVFPDSLDLVDPTFDFVSETRSATRVRQRDDLYPHEIFSDVPYDGLLVSKAIVDGLGGGGAGRYTIPQRQRLLRNGVREFFRLGERPIFTMGDCGAFTYVREQVPPYSVEDVAGFYENCGFQYGISVDHIILEFNTGYDSDLLGDEAVPSQWRERQEITLQLASEFLRLARSARCRFTPMGVAQGWSPASYAHAAAELQRMGYSYIALGGLVPLKTRDILAALGSVSDVRAPQTMLHLLGITRTEHVREFARFGAASFDSTSPLRQAFKDDKDNYYSVDRTYSAIRVPQVDANPKLQRRILAGEVDPTAARQLEQRCLTLLHAYDQESAALEDTLDALRAYAELYGPASGKIERSCTARSCGRPWRDCPCEVCAALGIHVIIFRGAERNRRRGFHNLYVFASASTANWATCALRGPDPPVRNRQKARELND